LVFVSLSASVTLHRAQSYKDRVDGEYIVVFSRNATKQMLLEYMQATLQQGVKIETFQINKMRGAFITVTPAQLAFHLDQDGVVDYISENRVVHIGQSCMNQQNAIWNLERVSERVLELGNAQGYTYDSTSGAGVTSYVIDTGIYVGHNEFQGRAVWGANFIDSTNDDCQGHGTHVAGTIAGMTYGVAKKTTVVAVKVLNCAGSGTSSSVTRGIEWVTNNHKKPANANMSLGGGNDPVIIEAVEESVAAGVVHCVAAGNSNADACNYSPANAPSAITAGATAIEAIPGSPTEEQEDIRSSFSNFGRCVDVFGPGSLITSAWIGGNTRTNTISGTSMASPHIAGVVSLIQGDNPVFTPKQVEDKLLGLATSGIVDLNCGGRAACLASPNKLVYAEC